MTGSWQSSSKTYASPATHDVTWRKVIADGWEKRQAILEQPEYMSEDDSVEPEITIGKKTFEAGSYTASGTYTMEVVYVDGVYSPELTDAYYQEKGRMSVEQLKILALELFSINVAKRLITGKDPITGEDSSRLLAAGSIGLDLIPFVGKFSDGAKAVKAANTIDKLDDVADAVKVADKVSDTAKVVDKVDDVADAGKVVDKVDDVGEVSDLVPGSPEHKAKRWRDYQAREGTSNWNYERWSKQYDTNMSNVSHGLKREALYRKTLGGESRVLKTSFTLRQIDMMDGNSLRQLKTGKVSLTKQAKIDLQKDVWLIERGYQVEYILEKGASKPFIKALEDNNIPYTIGSLID